MLSAAPAPWSLVRVADQVAVPARVRLAAVAGNTVVVATESGLYVSAVGVDTEPRELAPIPWAAGRLAMSPSGRFALVVASRGNQAEVVDVIEGRVVVTIGTAEARPGTAVATFATLGAQDVLVLSRHRHELEVLALPAGEALGRARFTTVLAFTFDSLHPMVDGDTVIAIGHGEGESKDSLLTLSVRGLIDDPAAAAEELRRRRRPSDYAYRLAAGPCGRDAMVGFRDPEDDERLEAGEQPEGDIDDHLGFYVRQLSDGRLLETIRYDREVASGSPLFATGSAIVLGQSGQVVIVPRAGAGRTEPSIVDAPVHAFDPVSGNVLIIRPDASVDHFRATQ